jgi:NAD(P)-dependent dehydrogenase (short-subunit alcohol dehydrogenase family)
MFDFSGRTILYTGAAGGLGLPTTVLFLEAGARVVAVDNDSKKTAALTEAAAAHRDRLIMAPLDLSDATRLGGELGALSQQVGGFDVVINNAAIYPSKPFEEFSIEEHQAVQRVNVDAAIVAVKVALPHMRERAWGRILNISSITFYGGLPLLAPYVASKGALIGLTRAWAREFGAYGITVNALSPGAFPTDAEKIHPDPEGYSRFVLDRQAVKRRGNARDIAYALMFFASDDAGFITGQTLNVDGGWVMV